MALTVFFWHYRPTPSPTTSPSASPSLPTSEPTDIPTYNIAMCDYWNSDVMEIQESHIVDTILLYNNINISFYIRTEENFTCSRPYCNFFRITNSTRTVKIPNLSITNDGELQLGLTINSGLKSWTFSDATFMQSHNDGQWHQYKMSISPNEVKLYYDALPLLDVVGDFDSSDYIGTDPTEYYIYSGATSDIATGYITNICIDIYATTPSPSSDPTNSPTADPTMYPIADSSITSNSSHCAYDIDGGDWILVRHTYNKWFDATDSLNGTADYGTVSGPLSDNEFALPFDGIAENDTQFLFSNGNCSKWLITTYGDDEKLHEHFESESIIIPIECLNDSDHKTL